MRQSKLFGRTNKSAPHDADSTNARLLIQAGFIDQVAAGVFSYLPLGLRVLRKVQSIVREEMDALGAQEILMPALIPKNLFDQTGRWDTIDVLFKLEARGGKKMGLGPTHEEVVTPLVQKFVSSYRDLPVAVYQIQDKFRDEPRAKSGLLRGREFSMKDLYSFHADEADFEVFYEKSKMAYFNIFKRCGLDAKIVEASGGVFSKFSHEFQVLTEHGEDVIFYCDGKGCSFAQNREIATVKEGDVCDVCTAQKHTGTIRQAKAIEVGNIFPLKTKFSDAFGFGVTGADGKKLPVLMGCYGIGPSRVVGSIVEVYHDDAGMIWPEAVAPFRVHLISLHGAEQEAESLYHQLVKQEIDILWDDRDASAGGKFADADLIGLPLRLVVSKKTLAEGKVEMKRRAEKESSLVALNEVIKML